jgi:hypothetical protein
MSGGTGTVRRTAWSWQESSAKSLAPVPVPSSTATGEPHANDV